MRDLSNRSLTYYECIILIKNIIELIYEAKKDKPVDVHYIKARCVEILDYIEIIEDTHKNKRNQND